MSARGTSRPKTKLAQASVTSGRAGSANPRQHPGKPRIARFVLVFVALCVSFNAFYWRPGNAFWDDYLDFNVAASAQALGLLGIKAVSHGRFISTAEYSAELARGCDGVQPTAFFVFAVLATPAAWSRRLIGIGIGAPCLLGLNLIRIVSLFCAAKVLPRFVETLHLDVWQGLYVLFGFGLWLSWAWWSVRSSRGQANASAA